MSMSLAMFEERTLEAHNTFVHADRSIHGDLDAAAGDCLAGVVWNEIPDRETIWQTLLQFRPPEPRCSPLRREG
jgi:hypothetical protein